MTPRQIALIRSSFAGIAPLLPLVVEAFYVRLFERNPNIDLMFRGDQERQEEQLAGMLRTIVASLSDLEAMRPLLRDLGLRHERYGVRPQDYEIFGACLIWTLERALGDDWSPEVGAAWAALLERLSAIMQEKGEDHAIAYRPGRTTGR